MSFPESVLLTLTARDLMRSPVDVVPVRMSLRAAAEFLYRRQIGGAPVVDSEGGCVGVLSTTDVSRWFQGGRPGEGEPVPRSMPGCSFQARSIDERGGEEVRCSLPPDVCPAQVERPVGGGDDVLLCPLPDCAFVDWQMLSELPEDAVSQHMTTDVVTASRESGVTDLARMMVDAHIHRILIVDEGRRPVGIVTATDVLAAVAREGLPRPTR